MSEPFEIKMKGFDMDTKEVKKMASSGVIYVSKDWIGKQVRVVLTEDVGESNKVVDE